MVPFLLTPREHHRVRTPQEYEAAHRAFITKAKRGGARYDIHDDPDPLVAYVSAGQWVGACSCGAGNSIDPTWPTAYCFACGAVHRLLIVPADHAEIERALLERPNPMNRNWRPGETIEQLRGEHIEIVGGLR